MESRFHLMKHYNSKIYKAFSLLEISLVILAISLLVSGVVLSSKMVGKSRISNARILTTRSGIDQIPDIVLWYEPTLAASFSETDAQNGNPVNTWYDVNEATQTKTNAQASATYRPTYTANGIGKLPTLTFNSASCSSLNGSNLKLSPFYTFFFVFNSYNVTTSVPNDLFSSFYDTDTNFSNNNNAGNGTLIENNTSQVLRVLHRATIGVSGGESNFSNSGSFSANTPYVFSYVRRYGSEIAVRLNHTLVIGSGVTSYSVATGSFTQPALSFTIGSLNDSVVRCFSGQISEIIIYNRALSDDEIYSVESYLGKKYSITLNQ